LSRVALAPFGQGAVRPLDVTPPLKAAPSTIYGSVAKVAPPRNDALNFPQPLPMPMPMTATELKVPAVQAMPCDMMVPPPPPPAVVAPTSAIVASNPDTLSIWAPQAMAGAEMHTIPNNFPCTFDQNSTPVGPTVPLGDQMGGMELRSPSALHSSTQALQETVPVPTMEVCGLLTSNPVDASGPPTCIINGEKGRGEELVDNFAFGVVNGNADPREEFQLADVHHDEMMKPNNLSSSQPQLMPEPEKAELPVSSEVLEPHDGTQMLELDVPHALRLPEEFDEDEDYDPFSTVPDGPHPELHDSSQGAIEIDLATGECTILGANDTRSFSRAAKARRIFRMLADSGDHLSSGAMHRFATLSGFEGTDADWEAEFSLLCKERRRFVSDGIDEAAFGELVNDTSETGLYCSDHELQRILEKVCKTSAESQPRGVKRGSEVLDDPYIIAVANDERVEGSDLDFKDGNAEGSAVG